MPSARHDRIQAHVQRGSGAHGPTARGDAEVTLQPHRRVRRAPATDSERTTRILRAKVTALAPHAGLDDAWPHRNGAPEDISERHSGASMGPDMRERWISPNQHRRPNPVVEWPKGGGSWRAAGAARQAANARRRPRSREGSRMAQKAGGSQPGRAVRGKTLRQCVERTSCDAMRVSRGHMRKEGSRDQTPGPVLQGDCLGLTRVPGA